MFRLLTIAAISMTSNIHTNAQSRWLDLYKGGTKVMSVDASKLDSIVFREDDSYISADPKPQQRIPISFCLIVKNQTRATTIADNKIKEFAVSCKKEDGTYLFANYLCKRLPDLIGKTETNTNGWDYVFGDQVTQYWENNATSYTFQAIAFKEGHHADVSFENGVASINVNSNNIGNVFITDNIKASNTNSSLVALGFSPLASKIELSFFEDVPGYDVEITRFYNSKGEDVDVPVIIGSLAYEGVAKVDWNNSQTTITPTSYIPDLYISDNNWRGKLSSNSWDSSSQKSCSTFILPGESIDVKIQFDLRLTSTTGEVIDMKQQEVSVPQTYTKWQSGLQYRYCFKISNPFSIDGINFYGLSISPWETEGETNITR